MLGGRLWGTHADPGFLERPVKWCMKHRAVLKMLNEAGIVQ